MCSEAFKNRKAKHAHTIFKNVTSRHHDKRTALPDLFTSDLQAKWLARLGKTLCLDMSTSLTPQASTAFDPKAVVQSLVDLLKEEPGIDPKYYEGIAKLKDDPDFERLTRQFDEAVSGQRNMINCHTCHL
ncbi:hypothetical protein AC249_AIPGENE24799 [Exaiptasia diaphana]|nr:hypothetical protein AC249_AIPGENE24799 [Exaiptasia diaphana]